MKNQELLNSIATLSGSIDALTRANKKDAVSVIAKKILELVAKLK